MVLTEIPLDLDYSDRKKINILLVIKTIYTSYTNKGLDSGLSDTDNQFKK